MKHNPTSEIITIGNELLIGQIIDTNSAWIAEKLNDVGITVKRITSIGDTLHEIESILFEASKRSEIIIVTGGLGPTNDDVTKLAIINFFQTRLVSNPIVLKHIEGFVLRHQMKMNELNKKQADVPEDARIMFNSMGTAPGLLLEKGGKIFAFLPGVPYEMEFIFCNSLLPLLNESFGGFAIYHETIVLHGIAESELSILLQSWENGLPDNIQLAYLPGTSIIRLRLTATGNDYQIVKNLVGTELKKIMPSLLPFFVGGNDTTIEQVVSNLLKENSLTVSTAESCTGGGISSLLTSIPGSSAYFKGGVVSYSNEVKAFVLNVDENLLKEFGAVSEPVVKRMAENVRKNLKTDYGIAVSGIAGPDGGTLEKPVGTVWIAVSSKVNLRAKKFIFEKDRKRNIQKAIFSALNELRILIIDELQKKQ